MIELGIALQSCTVCLVFYEKDREFPSSVDVLQNMAELQPLELVEFTGTVSDNISVIKNRIAKKILQS